ncbi:MAG: hypothetical protein E7667_06765 [Ruminococcaceae bacterium]|nr:hypothetical protein [Oscillospiraceae bacterium]
MMKSKAKEFFGRALRFILNPRLLLCLFIAWMITNGWAYIMFFVGTYLKISWMIGISGAYLAFLWLPVSPEKIVTLIIAIGLLRIMFPRDIQTLGTLRRVLRRIKNVGKKKCE